MWLYRAIGTILFVYAIVALGEEETRSLRLEEIIVTKLKTAARLRDNFGQVLSYIPTKNYEMHHSVKLLRKYLRDGGSLVNSLQVLPSIAHLPTRDQMNEILRSMENYMPRYVLPAVGIIRSAINGRRRSLDVEEILRPNYGPPKADLLYRIHAVDLPVAAEKITIRSTLKTVEERPELVEQALIFAATGNITRSGVLIARVLDNIKINNDNPEVRESLKHLIRTIVNVGNEFDNLTIAVDPYETVKNAVITIGQRDEDERIWKSARTLLPYLQKPAQVYCTPNKELKDFFVDEFFNHSLLISRQVSLINTEAGRMLLAIIERGDINMIRAFQGFRSMEYVKPIDLLIASISHLRRYQSDYQGTSLEALENVYADLMKKYRPDDWRKNSLRNAGRMKTALRGMISDGRSPRIRRLIDDIVTNIGTVSPEAWRKANAFVTSLRCYGSSCRAMQTLRALNESRGIENSSLKASVAELLTTRQEEMDKEVETSFPSLREELSRLETISYLSEKSESTPNFTINATDLLQAARGLVSGSPKYSLLREFLEDRKQLEKQLGEIIDVQAHPTRGRLLAWLLEKIAASEHVEENIRMLADDLVDFVSQEGYGAAGFEESAQHLWIATRL